MIKRRGQIPEAYLLPTHPRKYSCGYAVHTCPQCGCVSSALNLCYECVRRTEQGRRELATSMRMRKYMATEDGGPCAGCLHWLSSKCGLEIPEGGSRFAKYCSVFVPRK